ncbi:MAG: Nramp family divalent metal transporter [Pirellulales bacterium]
MANLAPWGRDDLPEPLPYSWRNALRVIGPGAILLATSIGGGEWLVGPAMAVKHGVGMMWIASVGILLQVLFNLEAIRYTLYTGEPVLSGIMRLKPGANCWGTFYVVLTAAQLGVPALAAASASVIFTAFTGRMPEAGTADAQMLIYITYAVMALATGILLFGGTVERMLEWASWAMVAFIFTFLVVVNVIFVPFDHSLRTAAGFVRFGYMPADVDWLLLAALAATAGSGGIGNLTISNWVRDKGWGMGGTVGAIPSTFGGKHIELSHTGRTFPITEGNLAKWRVWWRYVVLDQACLWGVGCLLGMFLNVNLAAAIIPRDAQLQGAAAGAFQAQYMAEHFWRGLWYLGLLNGFWILFSTHLGNTDILVRTITDVAWVASPRLRQSPGAQVGRVYAGLLLLFTVWGAVITNFGTAMQQFQVLGAIAGLVLVPSSLQILRINTTLLPPELRPAWWRRVALVACSLFYTAVCLLVLVDRLGG